MLNVRYILFLCKQSSAPRCSPRLWHDLWSANLKKKCTGHFPSPLFHKATYRATCGCDKRDRTARPSLLLYLFDLGNDQLIVINGHKKKNRLTHVESQGDGHYTHLFVAPLRSCLPQSFTSALHLATDLIGIVTELCCLPVVKAYCISHSEAFVIRVFWPCPFPKA